MFSTDRRIAPRSAPTVDTSDANHRQRIDASDPEDRQRIDAHRQPPTNWRVRIWPPL